MQVAEDEDVTNYRKHYINQNIKNPYFHSSNHSNRIHNTIISTIHMNLLELFRTNKQEHENKMIHFKC